mgnify:CR=1 FL=1
MNLHPRRTAVLQPPESTVRPASAAPGMQAPAYARCLCGHLRLMHGVCGCEGCFTTIDEQGGYGQSGACNCRAFVAADAAVPS